MLENGICQNEKVVKGDLENELSNGEDELLLEEYEELPAQIRRAIVLAKKC